MYRILLLFIASLFVGCDDFLTKYPTDYISAAQYYNTEKDLNDALTGVYDILGGTDVYGEKMQYEVTIGTDETYMTGTQPTGTLNTYQHDSSNGTIQRLWRHLYFGIERANNLIANINKPKDIDETRRGEILGEALFLRAYFYFMLVSNWGDVPLLLEPTPSVSDIYVSRTPSIQVYDRIIADMEEAEELLKDQTAGKLNFGGRISQSTVRGILARVCLQMAGYPLNRTEKYADAMRYADLVIQSGEHKLNPDYQQIFINYAQDKYDVKESIWEVEFWGNRSDSYLEAGKIGYLSGPYCGDVNIGYSICAIKTTGNHFKLYEADQVNTQKIKYSPDLRRDWNNVQYSFGTNADNKDKLKTPVNNIYDMGMGKWRREYESLEPKNKSFTPQNYPILRYSDVLLMYAEAANEVNNGPTTEAVTYVNMVRGRAYGKDLIGNSIKDIEITNRGQNYTTTPTINITGGNGERADAIARISGGRVSEIAIVNYGMKYTSTPTITISGGGGEGAEAKVILMDKVYDADLTAQEVESKESFLIAIQNERTMELVGESLRKYDLIRWGLLIENLRKSADDIIENAPSNRLYTAQTGQNVQERDNLLPIPAHDLNLNYKLVQNKGW